MTKAMNNNLIPQRETGSEEELLEGEIVLYSSTEAKALYLNESAALVWQLIDGQRSVAQIETLLAGAYPEAETLKDDVHQAIETLRAHGVIRV